MTGSDLTLRLVGILGQTQQFGEDFTLQSNEIYSILNELKIRFEQKLLIAYSHNIDIAYEFTTYTTALYKVFDKFNQDLDYFAKTPLLNVKYYLTFSNLQSNQQIIQCIGISIVKTAL